MELIEIGFKQEFVFIILLIFVIIAFLTLRYLRRK